MARPSKRIIVCCDGTWMDSDGDYQTPSNVTRIARAIPPVGTDSSQTPPREIPQLVYYQNGVGSGSKSLYIKYVGGMTGEGLAEHIREAYSFICLNYTDGDEIFLLGFSRGAFTARSISSLIHAVGLLTPQGLYFFPQVFEDWEFQLKNDYQTKWPNLPFKGHKPPVTDPHYQRELLERGLTRPNIKVKCVAVWDTVGGLGIPMIGLLPQPPSTDFAFVDTRVEANIEYAFQALALDERRRSFTPTVWDWPRVEPHDLKILKQTWFPGVHSDIGGSYDDTSLSNLTLAWMVSQLDPLLTIDHDHLLRLMDPKHPSLAGHQTLTPAGTEVVVSNTTPQPRPWGLGKIHNSMSLFFRLGGSRVRTPGQYREQELGRQTGTALWIVWKLLDRVARLFGHHDHVLPRLARTNETIHSSVRIRMGRDGRGYDDQGQYDSEALEGWVMHGVETDPSTPVAADTPGPVGKMKDVVWKKAIYPEQVLAHDQAKGSDGQTKALVKVLTDQGRVDTVELGEEPLGAFERQVLHLWPEIQKDFDSVVPGHHQRKLHQAGTYPVGAHAHNHHGHNSDTKPSASDKKRVETV